MHYINRELQKTPNVLASLRGLLPQRVLSLSEAKRIAELQANRLLALSGCATAPVPTAIITDQPHLAIDYKLVMPTSGAGCWNKRRKSWVITLNALEPTGRQRFSLFHEYKHIIDHGKPGVVALPGDFRGNRLPAELVAEYFAACVLMPKRWVKAAHYSSIRSLSELAALFQVSEIAMAIRLNELGITTPRDRCLPPDTHNFASDTLPTLPLNHLEVAI